MPKSAAYGAESHTKQNEETAKSDPLLRLAKLFIDIDRREHIIDREHLTEEA